MKSEYISWRYVLWCFGELKEDEWIIAKSYVNIFNIPLSKFYQHVHYLKRYKRVKCRYVKSGKWVFGVNENRIKEYQITPEGRKKTERWVGLGRGFIKKNDKVSCPNCGFNMNVKEFQFIDEVVNKKRGNNINE